MFAQAPRTVSGHAAPLEPHAVVIIGWSHFKIRKSFAQVLRDTSRRAQYDAARSTAATGPRGFSGGVYQPGVSEAAFEAAFRRWWEKAGAE